MIKNFGELKQQLMELSEIVNGFNSEAVQLRIVELVFGIETAEKEEPEVEDKPPAKKKRRPAKRKSTSQNETDTAPKKAANKPSGQGAVATLIKLVESGFFKTSKSIGDIVEHCDHNLARKFKTNEFSGKLGRLVREGTLVRTKNAESQYEYQSK